MRRRRLAGNMANISTSKHTADAIQVTGSNKPVAPSSSSTSVMSISRTGYGQRGRHDRDQTVFASVMRSAPFQLAKT